MGENCESRACVPGRESERGATVHDAGAAPPFEPRTRRGRRFIIIGFAGGGGGGGGGGGDGGRSGAVITLLAALACSGSSDPAHAGRFFFFFFFFGRFFLKFSTARRSRLRSISGSVESRSGCAARTLMR